MPEEDPFIYASTGTSVPSRIAAIKIYLEANKDWLEIVTGRRFYAGCCCECCSTKKRPGPEVRCECGVH